MSQPIRMVLGPALARMRNNMAEGRALLEQERSPENREALRGKIYHLTRALERIDAETTAWRAFMADLEDDADEMEIFGAFNQEGRHFLEWVEEAREVLDNIQVVLDNAGNPLNNDDENENGEGGDGLGDNPARPLGGGGAGAGFAGRARRADGLVRLPQISLPTFAGDPLEWLTFWESFQSAVDRQPLEAVDKLNYLMGCLTGKAASAVVGYRGGNNYGNVVATLTRLFGDQRVIKEALQAELINLPSCTDSVDSLQVFVENLERTCRQLVALGQPVDSSILCQVVKSKLPRSILTEVVKAERAEGRQWGVAELRTGLAEIAAIKAEVQRCAGPTQTQKREGLGGKPVDKGRAFIAGAKESIKGNNKGCLFCSKTHKSAECTQYK